MMEEEVDIDMQVQELTDTVKDVQDTNREILTRLNAVQVLDSQVCTCSCHTSESNLDVELREQKARIETLEHLVQELLSREKQGRSVHYCVSCGDKNATDECKQNHDGDDNRNTKAESRSPSRESTGSGPVRPQTPSDTGQAIRAGGQRLGGRPQSLQQYMSKTRSGADLTGQTPGGREKEHVERKSGVQRGPPRELKGILKHPPNGSRCKPQLQNTRETTSNVRPRTDEEVAIIPHTAAGTISSTASAGETTGSNGSSGRSSGTKAEDGSKTKNDLAVRCVHQDETRCFADKHDWASVAQMELNSGQESPQLHNLQGAHTAICLDISESMINNNAWSQSKTFLLEYLDELERIAREHNVTDEYVALVTFGNETRVVKRMTNKYEELRSTIDRVVLGGPSPMYGGLYLALAALVQSKNLSTTVNDMLVCSKVILVSDGMVTEARQQAGPDSMENKPEFHTDLLTPLSELVRRGIEVYCVPVGNANKSTMELLTMEVGRLWSREEGVKLARRYFLAKMMAPGITRGLLGPNFNPTFRSDIDFSDTDRLQMLEIFNEDNRRRWEEISRQREQREADDMYADSDRDNLLAVGSRVRRGPDFQAGDVDKEGPGTVVGHHTYMDKLWVMWDADPVKVYPCRYGEMSLYDVLPADDVRTPKPDGALCVGCAVKPNSKTKNKHPNIQSFDRGVVVRANGHNIWVKWTSGTHETHHYQPGRLEEIDFCPATDTSAPPSPVAEPLKTQTRIKNKNKNK